MITTKMEEGPWLARYTGLCYGCWATGHRKGIKYLAAVNRPPYFTYDGNGCCHPLQLSAQQNNWRKRHEVCFFLAQFFMPPGQKKFSLVSASEFSYSRWTSNLSARLCAWLRLKCVTYGSVAYKQLTRMTDWWCSCFPRQTWTGTRSVFWHRPTNVVSENLFTEL